MTVSRRNFLGASLMLSALGTATGANAQTVSKDISNKTATLKFFGQTPELAASTTPYGNNPSHGKTVRAGDVDIYYEVYGSGEPFLVLHGGGVGCSYEMGCVIDKLREKYRVIVPSTRGHGRSGFGTQPLTYEQKANDVMAVLKAEKVKSVRIFGFSDGGYAAYKIAEMFPSTVKQIITVGAGENIPGLRQISIDIEALKKADPEFMAQQTAIMPEPERWAAWLKSFGDFFNRETISKNLFMKIKCPVLLIVGELDPNAPMNTVLSAYQQIPNARLAVIPGAGHACFQSHFAAVWEIVRPHVSM